MFDCYIHGWLEVIVSDHVWHWQFDIQRTSGNNRIIYFVPSTCTVPELNSDSESISFWWQNRFLWFFTYELENCWYTYRYVFTLTACFCIIRQNQLLVSYTPNTYYRWLLIQLNQKQGRMLPLLLTAYGRWSYRGEKGDGMWFLYSNSWGWHKLNNYTVRIPTIIKRSWFTKIRGETKFLCMYVNFIK